MKDSDFTYEQRNEYYGDVNAVCHISNGYRWNAHTICINAKKVVDVDTKVMRIETRAAEKDGVFYSYYDVMVHKHAVYGSSGGVSYEGVKYLTEKEAFQGAYRKAMESLMKHAKGQHSTELLAIATKLNNAQEQLSLF